MKADIDSGRTGDKIAAYDPGLSQLGTDDEAAGRPPESARIASARKAETAPHRRHAARAATGHGRNGWIVPAFVGFAATAAVIVGLSLWLLR